MPATHEYRPRIVDEELDQLFGELAAVAVEGPKAVGKTALASRRATTVHALDQPGKLAVAEADPARLLEARPPILIDEWQRLPATWDLVRRAVEHTTTSGR